MRWNVGAPTPPIHPQFRPAGQEGRISFWGRILLGRIVPCLHWAAGGREYFLGRISRKMPAGKRYWGGLWLGEDINKMTIEED